MAKTAAATTEEEASPTGRGVTTQAGGGGLVPGVAQAPAELAEELGAGVPSALSDQQEDRGTPLLYVAQSMSKQVNPREPDHIPGLEVGDAFVNLTGEVFKAASAGVPFLPCYFRANLMEWTPREAGGGFHGAHPRVSWEEMQERWPGVKQHVDERSGDVRRDVWNLPNGHELILTHHYFGIVPDRMMPIVVPMSSTNLRASQQMQALLDGMKVASGGRIVTAPGWFLPWSLHTVYASNDQGNWYRWAPKRLGSMSDPETYTPRAVREVCAAFARLCAADEVKISKPLESEGSASPEEPPF